MSFRAVSHFGKNSQSFNMTPIIDIVFLLIIFFMVVCKFIEAENFPVEVPDNCQFAQKAPENAPDKTTLTIVKAADGGISFAVGSEVIEDSNPGQLAERLAELLDARLKDEPVEKRIVTLRIDKNISFSKAQYALAAVAKSSATDIQLAVLSDKEVAAK